MVNIILNIHRISKEVYYSHFVDKLKEFDVLPHDFLININYNNFIKITPIKQMNILKGKRKQYLMTNPHIHMTVSFQEINSYLLFVLVSKFQF